MMSALVISNDMVHHSAWLYTDQTWSGYFLWLFTKRGIAETEGFGVVAAQPSLKYRVDVCGCHWSKNIVSRRGSIV